MKEIIEVISLFPSSIQQLSNFKSILVFLLMICSIITIGFILVYKNGPIFSNIDTEIREYPDGTRVINQNKQELKF